MVAAEDIIISIIVPTYNRSHIIKKTINNILTQTYVRFELIIVDDCSADNTREVIKAINDPRVVYIRHDNNQGASAARNTGIKTARGKYIAFQDSDDEWYADKLEKQVRNLDNSSSLVGGVYGGALKQEKDKTIYIPHRWMKKEGDLHDSFIRKNSFIYLQSVMLKRECFEKAGIFDERLNVSHDDELFLRISKYYHFNFISDPLVIIHKTPESLTSNIAAIEEDAKIMIQKYNEETETNNILKSGLLIEVGHLLCTNSQLSKGRQYLFNAYKIHPANLVPLFAAAFTLFGVRVYSFVYSLYIKIRR